MNHKRNKIKLNHVKVNNKTHTDINEDNELKITLISV